MLRLVLAAFVIWGSCIQVQAADRTEMLQLFMGFAQQMQRLEQERRQQQELRRQGRQAAIDGLLKSCLEYNELACHQLIQTKGLAPLENYSAFVVAGDIESKRGDITAARTSYRHALSWARRMPNNGNAIRMIRARLASLNGAPRTARPLPPAMGVITSPVRPRFRPAKSKSHDRDLVCGVGSSAEWRVACLRVSKGPRGAEAHRKLSKKLQPYKITLHQVLHCDDQMQKVTEDGLACFKRFGIEGDELSAIQISALEYNILVEEARK